MIYLMRIKENLAMDQIQQSRKSIVIARIIAVVIVILALYMVIGTLWPVLSDFDIRDPHDYLFLLFFPIPMTLLGMYFFYVAAQIWQDRLTYKNLCKLSGVLSIILVFMLIAIVEGIYKEAFQYEEIALSQIQTPILMILAGILYLALKRRLLDWFAVEEEFNYYKHKSGTKLYFGFLALFIWTAISSTAHLLPRDPNYEHIAENTSLEGLIILGSIPAAYLIYRISLKLFLKKPPTPLKLAEKAMQNFKD